MHQRGHRDELTEAEAKELVLQAIAAGIDNDLGSGSNIDVCVITADRGLEHHRGAWKDPGVGSGGGDAAAGRQLAQGQSSQTRCAEGRNSRLISASRFSHYLCTPRFKNAALVLCSWKNNLCRCTPQCSDPSRPSTCSHCQCTPRF